MSLFVSSLYGLLFSRLCISLLYIFVSSPPTLSNICPNDDSVSLAADKYHHYDPFIVTQYQIHVWLDPCFSETLQSFSVWTPAWWTCGSFIILTDTQYLVTSPEVISSAVWTLHWSGEDLQMHCCPSCFYSCWCTARKHDSCCLATRPAAFRSSLLSGTTRPRSVHSHFSLSYCIKRFIEPHRKLALVK